MGGVIEEDGKVEFADTGAKPDSLEQTVAGAGSTGTAETASGVRTCRDKVWDAYKSLCGTFFDSNRPPQEDCYKEVIVNFLQMKYVGSGDSGWQAIFKLGQLSPENFLTCLKNIYGDAFDGTDVEDKIRTETHDGVLSPEITAFFPELTALFRLPLNGYWLGELYSGGGSKATLANPYLLVLCASPQYKPVIAGSVELAEKSLAFAEVNFNAGIDVATATHSKETLTKYVAQYAKQIGQSKNLIPILKELQRIPEKG